MPYANPATYAKTTDETAIWTSSATASLSISASTGDLVVVFATLRHASRTWAATTITDSSGSNTWSYGFKDDAGTFMALMGYSTLAANITSVSVSINSTTTVATFAQITAVVLTSPPASPLDLSNYAYISANTTHAVTLTGTTAQADEIVIACIQASNSPSSYEPEAPSGMTTLLTSQVHYLGYKHLSGAETDLVISATTAGTEDSVVMAATFKAAVTGGIVPVLMRQYRQRGT